MGPLPCTIRPYARLRSLVLTSSLLPALIIGAHAQTGWSLKSTTDQEPPIQAVAIADSHNAFAVGIRGNVLRSTDRGASWKPLWTGNNDALHAISFPEPATGTTVGNYGIILRTTDAGKTWERQVNGAFTSNDHFMGVAFSDRDHGVVVGGADIHRTADGGSTWSAVPLPGVARFLTAVSLRQGTGMAVGDSGRIVYSSDGGASWVVRVNGGGAHLRDVWVVDSARAFVAGVETILRTTDAGVTWSPVSGAGGQTWWTLSFIDSVRGFAGSSQGRILRTTDGGTTWASQYSTLIEISDDAFFDQDDGILATMAGRPIYTTDGGDSWQPSVLLDGTSFLGVSAIGESAAIVVGEGGTISRTVDAAESWTTLQSGTSLDLFGIDCFDSANCTVVGDSGLILRTTDGGTTWTRQTSGFVQRLRGVAFATSTAAIAVGDNGRILRTTNGGSTWLPRPGGVTFDLYAVAFGNAAVGIISGDSVAYRTVDGGLSWLAVTLSPSFRYRAAAFPSPTLGIVGGFFGPEGETNQHAFIHTTTDLGESWRYTSGTNAPGNILAASAPDPAHLFAAGLDGRIYRSIDGGSYWGQQPVFSDRLLHGISMYDSAHGFAVGIHETIQYTSDGGMYLHPPYLSSPPYGAALQLPQTIELRWSLYSSGVLSCRLQLSTDAAFLTGMVLDTTMAGTPTALSLPDLPYGKQFYWRMNCRTVDGGSQWSPVARFSTKGYNSYDVEAVQRVWNSLVAIDSMQNTNPGYSWIQSTPVSPAETLRLKAVCAVPPGELVAGAGNAMVVYDIDSGLGSWQGLLVEIVTPADPGFSGIQPGDSLSLFGTVTETPSPSMNSTTIFRATDVEVSGRGTSPAPIPGTVSDFYFNTYPAGLVRYSRGEQFEGMLVEFSDLLVASALDTASGTLSLVDGAGNSITMIDDSRWFTTRGHRDPASLYSPPSPGAFIGTLRGVVTTIAGSENNRGYCIAPVYPGDLVYGAGGGGMIRGDIFQDSNDDSVRGPGDHLAPHMQVYLTGKKTLTALTGNNARFQFDRLDSGTYSVTTEQRPGWIFTAPVTGVRTVDLPEDGSSTGNDIGTYFRGGFVGGTVFDDRDGDSVRDAGEPGLPGRTVRLSGAPTKITVTDAAGNYRFDKLPNGFFSVEVFDTLYWFQTLPGGTGSQYATVSAADLVADGIDFGQSYCVKLRFKLVVADAAGFNHDLWWGIRPAASYGIWRTDPQSTLVDTLEGEFEIPPAILRRSWGSSTPASRTRASPSRRRARVSARAAGPTSAITPRHRRRTRSW